MLASVTRVAAPEMLPIEAATGPPFADLVAARRERLGTPEDITLAALLASERASWTVAGHYVIDDGLTASLV